MRQEKAERLSHHLGFQVWSGVSSKPLDVLEVLPFFFRGQGSEFVGAIHLYHNVS